MLVFGLDSVGRSNSQLAFTTSGLAEYLRASFTDHDILGMAVNSGNGIAARALNIHEIGVRSLNKSLELVLSLFFFKARV